MAQQMVERYFPAMGTDIRLLARAENGASRLAKLLLDQAQAIFDSYEECLSRFRPESELSALNRSAGQPFRASPLLFKAVNRALEAARVSSGLFDPTVIDRLEAIGYRYSFSELQNRMASIDSLPPFRRHRYRRIRVREDDGTIRLPAGIRLDLGGIGKGLAVDAAAGILMPLGNFLVDAGGDIYAYGDAPDCRGWLVSIESPWEPHIDIALLRVDGKAVATSGRARRQWQVNGRRYHHIIDPRTGMPTMGSVISVTVVAPSATLADVHAKVAFIQSWPEGMKYLERAGLPALFALEGGEVWVSSLLAPYLEQPLAITCPQAQWWSEGVRR